MPSSEGAGVEPGEGETAVTGVGCAGIIAAGGSRIVVGNNDLVRIIRVSPGESLRLSKVGRSLGAGDQVNVRTAVREWREEPLPKPRDEADIWNRTALCF